MQIFYHEKLEKEVERNRTSAVTENEFLSRGRNTASLRICCYGSSSPDTPQEYLDQAYSLGKILALRGHVCVNGAGAFGCMGAMNQGAADHDGHIVGVVHEMFEVDGAIWTDKNDQHFRVSKTEEPCGAVVKNAKRELLIASGDDLQERKKMLVKDADALIVLPGGPGTWDELL